MLIRSTPYACFVMLRNGLTLELVYDRALIGADTGRDQASTTGDGCSTASASEADLPDDGEGSGASCGVWLMGETVLTEVVAGQA